MAQPSSSPLAKKLHLKPGYKLLLLNVPQQYPQRLEPLPDGLTVSRSPGGSAAAFDAVHLFVSDRAELTRHWPAAARALKPGGLMWVSYPKKSSKVKTDLTRDDGWDVVTDDGWDGVAMVAVDDVWSALRFRPSADVGKR